MSCVLAAGPRSRRVGVGSLFLTQLSAGSGVSLILCWHSDGQGQVPAESMAASGLQVSDLVTQAAGL